MASDACPSSNQRSDVPPPVRKPRGTANGRIVSAPVSDYCVVCGDRACSHHYYGVAACHGCKCFFWRSVKQQAQYECRFNNNCEITVNGRNACRACRFNRCLRAGMQPEAVRMNKPENPNACGQKRSAPASVDPFHDVRHSDDEILHVPEKMPKIDMSLISNLLEVDEKVYELADFSENEKPVRLGSVYEVFMYPECLDCYRTRVSYCVRLRRVTEEELNFCKRRMLTIACDYIRHLEVLQLIPESDKVALLRHTYGPLTIFEVTSGTVRATNDSSLLCLPTGITVSKNEELVSNSQKLVTNILDTLRKMVVELTLSAEEAAMLKAIIVLNSEIAELSTEAKEIINEFRDRVHNCLYQYCAEADPIHAATRFAKLLHIIPKVTLLARDLVEHIKVVHTFDNESNCVDPLFFELFGDIFQEERNSMMERASAQTTTPFKWSVASPEQSEQSVS